ncbi:unnamed protein product [Diatraea saccharalis]|uniref:Uncharacterized protein n=1 Tax=Diatraea saccharalis TaxID=40085 RepID=A0A9N9WDK3_9NEOP|nr:unnamed protein product [Diatraea saccharalis]
MFTNIFFVALFATLAAGQRPTFAGSRPIGYPEVIKTTTEGLGNRFGEDDATTVRLPVEANGDRDLVDRLSKLPIDQQPFWFINWQAYEAHRKNPQTYPQKPNIFVNPPTSNNMNFNPPNNNFAPPNNNFATPSNNFNPPNNNFNQNINNPTSNPGNQQVMPTGNNELSNRNLDSSDSLVPTEKIDAQNNPQEYIIVNGVLYKKVDSQKTTN